MTLPLIQDFINSDSIMAHYDFDNPIYQAEEEAEEDYELPKELARLVRQEEVVIQPHKESLKVINLGTEDIKKEFIIGETVEIKSEKTKIQKTTYYNQPLNRIQPSKTVN